jgi:hypothetical protein
LNRKVIQQGDVRLVPCDEPRGERELVDDGIVAHGEATGHKHRVTKGKVYRIDGELYVKADGELEIVHEEHGPGIKHETGWRKVVQVREWDHFAEEARTVMD